MKSQIILISTLFLFADVFSQPTGIHFEKGLNWQQILNKAKQENKYVFVDCYTTWCGPCKAMEKNIYILPSVGEVFDKKIISVKMQFDSTDNDDEDVKLYRPVIKDFEKTYHLEGYPTYLFFSPDGQLVTKDIGMMNEHEFISLAKSAINPEEQYYTLKKKLLAGDTSVINRLTPLAVKLNDREIYSRLHKKFVEELSFPFTKNNLQLIYSTITSSSDTGFKLIVNHADRVDKILQEPNRIEQTVVNLLVGEAYQQYVTGKEDKVNWKDISDFIYSKASAYHDNVLVNLKMAHAGATKQWNDYGGFLADYYDQFYHTIKYHGKHFEMNNQLWIVFENATDKKVLQRAAAWSKKTIITDEGTEDAASMDTYANLLYKSGNKEEAITWEEKAFAKAKIDNDEELISSSTITLQKMKAGQPTWTTKSLSILKQ
jgi:thiol-disulfide isomerase/thioredoxin